MATSRALSETETTRPSVWPPLIAAIFCTLMIIEALFALRGGLANGDLMVMVCPILGAAFISIPAWQAWLRVIQILRMKTGEPKIQPPG